MATSEKLLRKLSEKTPEKTSAGKKREILRKIKYGNNLDVSSPHKVAMLMAIVEKYAVRVAKYGENKFTIIIYQHKSEKHKISKADIKSFKEELKNTGYDIRRGSVVRRFSIYGCKQYPPIRGIFSEFIMLKKIVISF